MRHLLASFGLAILATGFGLTSASATTNLVANGDFSTPNQGGGWSITAVPGWTSTGPDVPNIEVDNQLVVMPTYYLGIAGQSAELNGNGPDTISQTISGLTIGDSYLLSWGYGDRPGNGPYTANVYFGGTLVTTDTGTGTGDWTTNSFVVKATSLSEVLAFEGIQTGNASPSYGNEIAAVSLTSDARTQSVPEPISLSVFGAGLLGAAALRRRKSKTA